MVERRYMAGFFSIHGRSLAQCLDRWLLLSWLAFALAAASPACAQEKPTRLLDQQPFDRVTLDAASGNEKIDTLLLDLPNRSLPNPLPAGGSLELRRRSEPSVLYTVPWTSIARIDLFEQLLLAEAGRLATAKDLHQAYEYFYFLHKNYPDLTGLNVATEKYLRQDALATYAKKNYEETLTILLSLYDLNPKHRGLSRFVERVTDRLISGHLSARDFAAARSVLEMLSSAFPELRLANIDTWRGKFETGAARQLKIAREANEQENFLKARQALRRALAILPTAAGAVEMLEEIDRSSPQIFVGVDQLAFVGQRHTLDWSTARISQLTEPKIVNLTGFGAEGGDYHCPWAEMTSDDRHRPATRPQAQRRRTPARNYRRGTRPRTSPASRPRAAAISRRFCRATQPCRNFPRQPRQHPLATVARPPRRVAAACIANGYLVRQPAGRLPFDARL